MLTSRLPKVGLGTSVPAEKEEAIYSTKKGGVQVRLIKLLKEAVSVLEELGFPGYGRFSGALRLRLARPAATSLEYSAGWGQRQKPRRKDPSSAAFYISFAELPARLLLNDHSFLSQSKPAYAAYEGALHINVLRALSLTLSTSLP